MAKCSVCGKGVVYGQNVSHSNRKTNRTWKPNIRKVKAVVDGTHKTVAVCSRCLRSGKVTRALFEYHVSPCPSRIEIGHCRKDGGRFLFSLKVRSVFSEKSV